MALKKSAYRFGRFIANRLVYQTPVRNFSPRSGASEMVKLRIRVPRLGRDRTPDDFSRRQKQGIGAKRLMKVLPTLFGHFMLNSFEQFFEP